MIAYILSPRDRASSQNPSNGLQLPSNSLQPFISLDPLEHFRLSLSSEAFSIQQYNYFERST